MRQRATRLFSIGANGKAPSGPVPSLDLDFLAMTVAGTLDSRITYTRSGPASTFDATGAMVTLTANQPRLPYDPITLQPAGFLIELQAQNLLLNSATLSTQNVTVSAQAHTLSFYGSGTITASGTASFTLTGTGAYPARVQITFTPTAGTLTLTVTGTVQFAQLEVGSIATSWIPTTTTVQTRGADNANITGTNFTAFYNQPEGTVNFEYLFPRATFGAATSRIGGINAGSGARVVDIFVTASNTNSYNGTTNVAIVTPTLMQTVNKVAATYKSGDYRMSLNGVASSTVTSALLNTANQLQIGNLASTGQPGALFRRCRVYPTSLTNAEINALTT